MATQSEALPPDTASESVATRVLLRNSLAQAVEGDAKLLASLSGISEVSARILLARGIVEAKQVADFLSPNLRNQLPNPATIKNIGAAASLILDFVESGELITIYNDFDVDGISSAAQLLIFLRALGAKVDVYTPSRFSEGYGLVLSAVERLGKLGTKLLVTVDCGISSLREFALASSLGMKSIVLDHHIPGSELPPADVVVDPAQNGCPFGEHKLAAAGLVWMLLIVLRQQAKERFRNESGEDSREIPDPKEFLDLAALGTICDMVPLVGVNRVIAHRGVEALRISSRPGIAALRRVAGAENNPRFGAGQVAFALGPRINAAGRLANASDVVLMLTTDDSLRARAIADAIDRLNEQRRQIEDEVKLSCLSFLAQYPAHLEHAGLALFGADFHIGVIGIVAQRMVEKFHRPTAVMAPGELMLGSGERKPVVKGSVRSVSGFHVAEVLQSLAPLLLSHGGHREAGGFSLEFSKLEEFQSAFVRKADEVLGKGKLAREILADVEAEFAAIDFDLVNELMRFAPFGVGNPAPVLITKGVDIESVSLFGDKHLRVRFSQGRYHLNGIGWGMGGNNLLRKGMRVNLAYQPEINTYQGVSSVQLNLREIWTES